MCPLSITCCRAFTSKYTFVGGYWLKGELTDVLDVHDLSKCWVSASWHSGHLGQKSSSLSKSVVLPFWLLRHTRKHSAANLSSAVGTVACTVIQTLIQSIL